MVELSAVKYHMSATDLAADRARKTQVVKNCLIKVVESFYETQCARTISNKIKR